MSSTNRDHRRLKRVEFSPEVLLTFLKESFWECVQSEIPWDAEFKGISHNTHSNTWSIFIRHDSFSIIDEGEDVPKIANPLFKKIVGFAGSSL